MQRYSYAAIGSKDTRGTDVSERGRRVRPWRVELPRVERPEPAEPISVSTQDGLADFVVLREPSPLEGPR